MSQVQILAIPGSLRAGSWNAALLRLAQERAPEGVQVEIWEGLRTIPPFSEDHEILAPAPVEALRQAIAESDALLVATPEYNGGAPGQLKNALDWASRPYGIARRRRQAGRRDQRQHRQLRRPLGAGRGPQGAAPERRGGARRGPGGRQGRRAAGRDRASRTRRSRPGSTTCSSGSSAKVAEMQRLELETSDAE